jgi:hypothetical protein
MSKYVHTDRKNSKKNVYHIDRNCTRLKGTGRPVSDSEIEYHNLRLCQWCDPDVDHPNAQHNQDYSYQEALKEAAKDE